ncbi:MAG: hypothetical protein U9N81_15165 [Bacillota bacterium]|nr:hypothetical protein [Bacillota bacterium]
MIIKHVKNEKGSIMIETVCANMLLLICFLAFMEAVFMYQGSMYTQRIASVTLGSDPRM